MSLRRNHAPVHARAMGRYDAERDVTTLRGRSCGARGPLSGQRILIRSTSGHERAALTATLTYTYLHMGAYYARLDVLPVETVVHPNDWELLPLNGGT